MTTTLLTATQIAPTSRDGLKALSQVKRESVGDSCAIGKVDSTPKWKVVDKQFLVDANRTDPGNAECLAHLYGDTLRYCNQRKKWLTWDGSIWRVDECGAATRLMINTCRERYKASIVIDDLEARKKFSSFAISSENTKNIDNALKAAKSMPPFSATINQFDNDNMAVVAGDTTIDLNTGKTRPCTQEDYFSLKIGAKYDSNAGCPLWLKFLNEIFLGDQSIVDFVQSAVGYCLTGNISEQKIFMCVGDGSNGKSVLLNIISALLGDYGATASFDTFDADRRSTIGNDLAVLKGKRVVMVIESDEDRRLSEARVKSVTGNEDIKCRFLYGEQFEYRPTWKVWLATNHKPSIRGSDNGIWRRIVLIPFEATFSGESADKNLESKLLAELPGILNWALEGLKRWQQESLVIPPKIAKAIAQYRDENDILGQWIDERTIQLEGKGRTTSSDLYRSFKCWYQDMVGRSPMSQAKWSTRLEKRGYRKSKVDGIMNFYGIGLNPSDQSSYSPY